MACRAADIPAPALVEIAVHQFRKPVPQPFVGTGRVDGEVYRDLEHLFLVQFEPETAEQSELTGESPHNALEKGIDSADGKLVVAVKYVPEQPESPFL